MYPALLDDQSLANQFQMFIETIDESYEVSLSTNQQYPVSSFIFPVVLLFLSIKLHLTVWHLYLVMFLKFQIRVLMPYFSSKVAKRGLSDFV